MVKIKGPLLSEDAHGSLSKTLTYSHRKTGQQVREYNKPSAVPSAKQRGQHRLTEFLVAHWQNMSAAERATWETNAKASGKNLPGYQYFLREAQRDLYTHHGLCGYWHCNEIVGGKVLDLSGNGNHGTLGPIWPSNAPTLVKSRSLKFGKALNFDGVDSYVEITGTKSLQVGAKFTYEMWIKAKPCPTTWPVWLGKTPHSYFGIRQNKESLGDKIFFEFANPPYDGSTYSGLDIVGINLMDDEWFMVEVTYDGDIIKIYKDGIYVSQASGHTLNPALFDIRINENAKGIGKADEVCIYNRALSAEEIATRYKFAMK